MLNRVAAALAALSPSERRVARLALEDARTFAALPVEEIARRSGVSPPSVVRFCRSVGYSGIADFRRKLACDVAEGTPFVHRCADAGDKPADVFIKVVDDVAAGLLRYRDEAHLGSIDRAVQAIVDTHGARGRVDFFGVAASDLVAADAAHKFARLGLQSASRGGAQPLKAASVGAGDTLIVVSNSGRTRAALAACESARDRAACTIAITCSDSPLARTAAISLRVDHQEGFGRYAPGLSRLLHLVAVDVLTTAIALRLGPAVQQHLNEFEGARHAERLPYAP